MCIQFVIIPFYPKGFIMKCPKCNSENTQRLEVVYDNGTHDINTKSKSSGIGFGRGGIGFGLGSTKTSGKSVSGSAQKAALPSKKSFKYQIIGLIAGVYTIGSAGSSLGFKIAGVAVIAASAYVFYKNITYNSKVFPNLYQTWLNSWFCTKCGSIYS